MATMPTVRIDLNSRSSAHGGDTVALLEDVVGDVERGSWIMVSEPEDEVEGWGVVTERDDAAGLIYISVDWPTLRDAAAYKEGIVVLESPRGARPGLRRMRSFANNAAPRFAAQGPLVRSA